MRPGSCPRQPLSPPESSRSMRQAIATALPIVLGLILLPAIAFASPPDPSWVAGFYDGADGDDIVCLVYETSATSATAPSHLGPLPCLLEVPLEGIARNVPGRDYTRGPRSPPVLRSPEFGCVFNSLPPPTSGAEAPLTIQPLAKFRPSWSGDLRTLRVAIEIAPHAHAGPADAPTPPWPPPRGERALAQRGGMHGGNPLFPQGGTLFPQGGTQ